MIHQLLHLTRPLFVIDTETTGLNPKCDRIIEIGFQRWTSNGMDKEWRSLIDPGVPIPAGAPKTHGILDSSVRGCRVCLRSREAHIPLGSLMDPTRECEGFRPWPRFEQLAENLAMGFTDCDYAGKNVRFDLRMFSAEFARAKVEWSYLDARIIDADRLEQLGEPRTLSHLYEKHLGKKLEDAHEALSDVRGTTEVIVAQLQKYQTLPRDLDILHATQWPGWIDGDGKFRFNEDGVPCVGQWGKYAGRPMRDVNPGYWDFILSGDFSPDVKALASAAKMGKFPEAK